MELLRNKINLYIPSPHLIEGKHPHTRILQKAGKYMPSATGIIRDSIIEFSRLQNWMLSIKEISPDTYQSMYKRYLELKRMRSRLDVNLSELNKAKE